MTGGLTVAELPGVRAAIFDFNGTITDDELLQYEIYAQICAERLGVDLDRHTYFTELAGRSDPGIVEAILRRHGMTADAGGLIAERVSRYAARVTARPPVRPGSAALIRALHGRIPLAVGTGALRSEVDLVLSAGGLAGAFDVIVTIEDVAAGKPDPEAFLLALDRLNDSVTGQPLSPADVVVFEDSPFGIAAARAAGMRCVGAYLTGETDGGAPERIVGALGPELITTP